MQKRYGKKPVIGTGQAANTRDSTVQAFAMWPRTRDRCLDELPYIINRAGYYAGLAKLCTYILSKIDCFYTIFCCFV